MFSGTSGTTETLPLAEVTTSTTTTTTTAFAGPTLYIDGSAGFACGGAAYDLPTYLYTGTQTLCGCTSLNAANATILSAGTYWVSDLTNRRQFSSTGGGSTLLTAVGSCTSC